MSTSLKQEDIERMIGVIAEDAANGVISTLPLDVQLEVLYLAKRYLGGWTGVGENE